MIKTLYEKTCLLELLMKGFMGNHNDDVMITWGRVLTNQMPDTYAWMLLLWQQNDVAMQLLWQHKPPGD